MPPPRRVLRLSALIPLAAGAGACAALLGIEDRSPELEVSEAGPTGDVTIDGPDEGSSDASSEEGVDARPRGACAAATCQDAGGACTDAGCLFDCTGSTSCKDGRFTCPPNSDCHIVCTGDHCESVACQGGSSCTLECSGAGSCKKQPSCESELCVIVCRGKDACKEEGPVHCDASICVVECLGQAACDKGVLAQASTYCGITCSGPSSCKTGDVTCGAAPDAAIVCGTAVDTCKDGKPSCLPGDGGFCRIECNGATSCGVNYCCDASTCLVDASGAAKTPANVCP